MKRLKEWLNDFPSHNGAVVTALLWINATALAVCVRLALGEPFPAGYDMWLLFLAGLAGVNVAGLGIKRATDFRYKQAGAAGVNVEGPSTVNVDATTAKPVETIVTKEVGVVSVAPEQARPAESFDPPGEGG